MRASDLAGPTRAWLTPLQTPRARSVAAAGRELACTLYGKPYADVVNDPTASRITDRTMGTTTLKRAGGGVG